MTRKLAALVTAFVLALMTVAPATAAVTPAPPDEPAAVSAPTDPTDETQVPHYFGPYPNWANSPLTMPDVDVAIVGDGSGASAEASVGANGAVTGITITNPGSGYTAADVQITGAGTGASASASITASGAVTAITVDAGGGGYTSPIVTIGGGGGVDVPAFHGNAMADRTYSTDFPPMPPFVAASATQVASRMFDLSVGSATGGQFSLGLDGNTVGPFAFDVAAGDLEAALTGTTVTGTGPWLVVFASAPTSFTIDGASLTQGVADAAGTAGATPDVFNVTIGSATGGSFTLTVDAVPTSPIPFDAVTGDIEAALLAAGFTATVAGSGTIADPWIITFATAPTSVAFDGAGLTQGVGDAAVVERATYAAHVGSADAGTFVLTIDTTDTAAIAWNASAADVQAALSNAGFTADVSGAGSEADPWVMAFDTAPASVTLDATGLVQPLVPVFVVVQAALPDGTLRTFQSWNMATGGGSPAPSAGGRFHAYILRPTGVANQFDVVFDSGELTVPALSGATSEVAIYNVPDQAVQAGDVVAFYGAGIPLDVDTGTDLVSYPAPAAPAAGGQIDFGGAGFPAIAARDYAFGANVTTVAAPSQATATAYGGVDAVTITDFGSGYSMPTVDFDWPDDPNGLKAQGRVVCVEADCTPATEGGTVTITGVEVTSPGSGYANAPKVAIRNGTLFDPVTPLDPGAFSPAAATATLVIQNVIVETFGSGYTSPPTVAITDGDGSGSGALATASVAAGTVSSITLDTAGSGYVTAGGIKKFTDQLPGLCTPPGCPDYQLEPDAKYIPLAVADQSGPYQGAAPDVSDTYEVGLVQYRTSFSSSLPPTLVRGYVQLETAANAGISQHFPLYNELLDGTRVPILKSDGTPWLGVTPPQWLGPTIVATKGKAVRIVFRNFLPTGAEGDLFLPVDSTMMGSGMGPMDMPPATDDGTVLDEVRNPACTQYPKPDMCFADNRATLHLHGGITPWISDGTPHQWITPAGESTPWPEGVSVENVPDMDVCTADDDGCQTFYYTNQQSARLMFYHDHAWGITRLNVYAGEAAGYVITDDTDQALIASGAVPADQLPLVIQDRTFVPDEAQLMLQDPTWDAARWGGKGSFWYHHVYMPAQNPGDPSGMSGYGRWMFGPWFWPPAGDVAHPPIANPYYDAACKLDEPSTWQYDTDPFCEPPEIPGTPLISAGMEQFNDTPIVNGTAYPTVELQPKSYRLRVLNAANDRFWNLQWYVGDPGTASTDLNVAGQPIGPTEVAFNEAELAAAQLDPVVFPSPDTSNDNGTDATFSLPGPDWVHIGTEGGFLPSPVVVDGQQVTTWITDPTRFDVGNVDQHSLLLAPAERADAIVDFSKFAGKTLILYNDAPAAFPARIPQYDYYTGAPDLSPAGAPTILPGYGPNTRTVMQVKIADAQAAPAFDLTKLRNEFKHQADGSGVFEAGQNPIVVGQATYNTAYGTNFVTGGDCNSATPAARCDGYARIDDQGGQMWNFNTIRSPNSKTAVRLEPKAIHDEMNSTAFDPFGRMQAFLGLEAVPATPGLQNFMAYPYVSPTTEIIDASKLPQNLPPGMEAAPIASGDDGTQIWKFTHNGVDTHPIHFHLYDVQLLNRVSWDNIISPPDLTELGWKDTVRINPLQDTYVALRPVIPTLPFELPNSVRPLDPSMPIGATLETQLFTPQGQPAAPIINRLVNFGWEYVFHCHILSHEEMDMMRGVSVALPPDKATGLTYVTTGSGNNTRLTLTWTDNSLNETSFVVQRRSGPLGVWTTLGSSQSPLDQVNTSGDLRTFTDATFRWNSTQYFYRVVARNTVGYGGEFPAFNVDAVSSEIAAIRAPSNLNATLQTNAATGIQVRLTFTDNSLTETGFAIERSTDGLTFSQIATAPPRNNTGGVTYDDTTVTYGSTYTYRVATVTAFGNSGPSNTATVVVPTQPAAPTDVVAVNGPNGNGNSRSVILTWTDNSTDETVFTVQRATNAGFTSGLVTTTVAANLQTTTLTGLSRNTSYYIRIRAANGAIVASAWVAAAPSPILTNP